jgi:putative nucleotidyltransferase with HDIG domain
MLTCGGVSRKVGTLSAQVLDEAANLSQISYADTSDEISLSEIVSSLSFALDLTEGAVPGHALRSCMMGMSIARKIGMSDAARASLYYALLLKDAGCSSNAGRMCEIVGGDDRETKRGIKLQDWTKVSVGTLQVLWNNVLPDANPVARAMRIIEMGMHQSRNNAEMIQLRCDRGAQIALKIGLDESAAIAIRHLDEHWDGGGYPSNLRGREIPLASRIMALAQHLDAFASEQGAQAAMSTLRERSGRWFDPELVKIAESLDRTGELWSNAESGEALRQVLDMAPESGVTTAAQVDHVCEAFADIVDAKSSFTYRHSVGVTQAALKIAMQMGLSSEQKKMVWRAALLHDVGKLGVSNTILDKPSKLDQDEWASVRMHPVHTQKILERIKSFSKLAGVAGAHHEKLDGTGYPYGLSADQLSIESRIIAVADVYGALSEERPYREALSNEQVFAIMVKDVPHKLDGQCFEALKAAVANSPQGL